MAEAEARALAEAERARAQVAEAALRVEEARPPAHPLDRSL